MNEFTPPGPDLERAMDQTTFARKGARVYSRLGWAFLVFLGSMILVPSAVAIVVSMVDPDLLGSAFFGMPLSYMGLYLIGLPLMLLTLRDIPSLPVPPAPAEGKKMSVPQLLALYPVLYAVMSVISMITSFIEHLLGSSATITTEDLVAAGGPAWITFVIGVIVAPVMEEVVFRGLVYRKAAAYGSSVYILWTSIIFGLFHLNFGQSIYAGVMGVIFAVVMLRTGSVRYGIILHVMINFTGGVGIGSIILRSGSELALSVYGIYSLVLMAAGIVIGFVLLVRRSKAETAQPVKQGTEPLSISNGTALLNAGTVTYCAICLLFIVGAILMSALA